MLGVVMAFPTQAEAQSSEKSSAQCKAKENYETTSFKVDGKCSMCKDRIETTAQKVGGVKKAKWNKKNHKLTLVYHKEKINLKDVHRKIAEAGHDTGMISASDEAYASLPQCCKYRED